MLITRAAIKGVTVKMLGTPSNSPTRRGVCGSCASLGRPSFGSRAGPRALSSNFTFRMV